MTIQVKAWTGGSVPRPTKDIDREEMELVRKMYKDQVKEYAQTWGEHPSYNLRRIFWRRARHDAHATFRSRITFREAQFPNSLSSRRILVFVGDSCVGEIHEDTGMQWFNARQYEPFAVKDGFIELLGNSTSYGSLESAKQHFVSKFS